MSPAGKPTDLRFEPPNSGFWEQDPVHFPAGDALLGRDASAAFLRGTSEFCRGYGMLIDGLEMAYINGFGLQAVRPAPRTRSPSASSARRRSSRRSTGASSSRLERDAQARRDQGSPEISRSIRTRSPTRSSPITLARCQRHHAEMLYQHMRFTAAAGRPDGRLPRARRRLDRPSAAELLA
jgi:hypothetical protein